MATVRTGDQQVLMVVDLQVGVVADAWEADRVVGNAVALVERARAAGVPVVWVQHDDDDLVHGSAEWQLVPELVPGEHEPVVAKHHESSFENTPLEQLLADRGATHVVLAGAATNWCIRATAYGALDRGYDLTLVKDAHTTSGLEFQDGRTIPATHFVDDLNVAMQYLSYPGRTNAAVPTDELQFDAGG